jgi:hypothetical protein
LNLLSFSLIESPSPPALFQRGEKGF